MNFIEDVEEKETPEEDSEERPLGRISEIVGPRRIMAALRRQFELSDGMEFSRGPREGI